MNLFKFTLTQHKHHGFFKQSMIASSWLMAPILMTSTAMAIHPSTHKKSSRLMIDMTPALCQLNPNRAKLKQCLEGYHLTVFALDLDKKMTCKSNRSFTLSPLQKQIISQVMPDEALRQQAWQNYGACGYQSESDYFRQITHLTNQLKLPKELNTGNSYTVNKTKLTNSIIALNPGLSSSGIDFMCQDANRRQAILTQIHICYEYNQFGQCQHKTNSCGDNFIILGSH